MQGGAGAEGEGPAGEEVVGQAGVVHVALALLRRGPGVLDQAGGERVGEPAWVFLNQIQLLLEEDAIWLRSSIMRENDVKNKRKEKEFLLTLFSSVVILEAREEEGLS